MVSQMRQSGIGAATLLLHLAFGPWLHAKDAHPPVLDQEHEHPSGALTFRTPASWKVETMPGDPLAVQAWGDGVIVRFVYRKGDNGFDIFHSECMLNRLAGPFDMDPQVKYEYDFLQGSIGDLRILDSAFITRYDAPINGETEWRQRNLTIVGAGHSLCAIAYVPLKTWRKSKSLKPLLEAVVKSISFRQP
jgi:hypothetical protein